MNLRRRLAGRMARTLVPPPFRADFAAPSMIAPLDSPPSERLIGLALHSIENARQIDLGDLGGRAPDAVELLARWPGEHYRLLAGLVKAMRPRHILEIGSGGGLSALSMAAARPDGCAIDTFDVAGPEDPGFAWGSYLQRDPPPLLRSHRGDLSRPEVLSAKRALLEGCDLVFIDAAKDGVLEPALMARLQSLSFDPSCVLVLDDIRMWNMLAPWRAIKAPKLDLTSFGHWSGTGIVEWGAGANAGPFPRR